MLRRLCLAALALTLLVGPMAAVIAIDGGSAAAQTLSTSQGANLSDQELTALGAPACPQGYTCAPMPCPQVGHCGVVEAGPTSNLGANQYVFLSFYGFHPSDGIFLFYCHDSGSWLHSPVCLHEGLPQMPVARSKVYVPPSGSLSYSFQIDEADAAGTPLCGLIPQLKPGEQQVATKFPCGQNPTQAGATYTPAGEPFYCDNNGHNCSIFITDSALGGDQLQSPESSNSLVIPISFQNLGAACTQAKQIVSQSEWGIDRLLSSTSQSICSSQGSNAVVPVNTFIDGLSALQALQAGSIQVAFTDDPQSASQQAIIKKEKYRLIPLAFSATTMAYRGDAVDNTTGNSTPYTATRLTAENVAEIIGGTASAVSNIDLASCAGYNCSIYQMLNEDATFAQRGQVTAFVRSDASGVIDQALSWICAMRPMTLSLQYYGATYRLTEPKDASTVLKAGIFPTGGAPAGCLTTDKLPNFNAVSQGWTAVSTPDQQNLKMLSWRSNTSNLTTGFAPMNWAMAGYYGMATAAVQNAAGSFVAPSPASINAAISDGTWNSDGMWTPSYTNSSDAAAYPMTSVLYAVVPSSNIRQTDASNIQTALTQMISVVDDPKTSLASGLVPLSPEVAKMAMDEVSSIAGTGSPTSHSGSSISSSRVGVISSPLSSTGSGSAAKQAGTAPTPSSSPLYGPLLLTSSASRLIVPAVTGSGILLGLIGLALITFAVVPRRRPAATDEGAELAAEPGDQR
jgi:hypothetical protein